MTVAQPVPEPNHRDAIAATVLPRGGIARRPLHFIVATDCTAGMNKGKMQAFNFSMAMMLSQLAAWENKQENVQVLIRVIGIGTDRTWHIQDPTPVVGLRWPPLRADARYRPTGAAMRLIGTELTIERLEPRAWRPVLLLIVCGDATDDFDAGLAELLATPGGAAALRVAMWVTSEMRRDQLADFSDPGIGVVHADLETDIPELLVATSTMAVRMVVDDGGHDLIATPRANGQTAEQMMTEERG